MEIGAGLDVPGVPPVLDVPVRLAVRARHGLHVRERLYYYVP